MLLDKPLRLCNGAGNGVDAACLMTATNMLIGCGDKGDEAVCVCPVLRAFIIETNDAMPDGLRQELYGPLPWLLIGTKTDDVGVMVRRAKILSEAVQEFAESAKSAKYSAKYAAMSAKFAKSFAESAAESAKLTAESAAKSAAESAKFSAGSAAESAKSAECAAKSAECAAESAKYAAMSAEFAESAESAKSAATSAKFAVEQRRIWTICRDALVRAAEVGSKTPMEIVMTPDEIYAALSK